MPATTAGKIKEVLDALVDQLIDSLSPAQPRPVPVRVRETPRR